MIPDSKIAEIRERADVIEIIGEYVTLKRAGVNFKGVCPFHADSDPSFNVNPARQFYHCFGCGASGDVFKFVQNIEGLSFMEAVERLAGRYGVELPKADVSPLARTAMERKRQETKRRRYILEAAAEYFESCLWAAGGEGARAVLQERGISQEVAREYRLGFAPDSWQGLLDHFRELKIGPREAEEVGLSLPRKGGGGYYDRFRDRLMFTVSDPSGQPVAFSGRALGSGEKAGAKYINSPETKEYTKGKILFGLHQARVHLSKTSEAVLAEGNFDVVALAQAGVRNVVAPLGTALTEDQAAILKRRVERVVVMFDGDKAGRAAAARAFPLFAKSGLAAYVASLPEGEDPDSLIRSKGPDSVKEILDSRRGLLDEIIRVSALAGDGTAQDIARRISKLGPFIGAVRDSMERDVYKQRIADAFAIEPRLVFSHLKGKGAEPPRTSSEGAANVLPVGKTVERELVGVLLDLPQLCEEVETGGLVAEVTTAKIRGFVEELVLRRKRMESDISELISQVGEDAGMAWIAKRAMETLFDEEEKGREALKEIGERMRSESHRERVRELDHMIRLANASGDDIKVLELQRQRTQVQKEMTGADLAFDKARFRD